jgi:AcrR family transcriptional regulator
MTMSQASTLTQLEFTLNEKTPGTLKPGGRTTRTRAAVLNAVIAELTEHGYADASVERVAARAGIAKTTIYRRWGGLGGLLADLMAGYAVQEIPLPDEGDLGSDLRALSRSGGRARRPGHRGGLRQQRSRSRIQVFR